MDTPQEMITHPTEGRKEKKGIFRLGLVGALSSGFLASICCIGPLIVVFLGIGGAGLLMKFEPYRPLFGTLMLLFLGLGFYLTYRRPKTSGAENGTCCTTESRKRQKIALWIATIVAVMLFAAQYLVPLALA